MIRSRFMRSVVPDPLTTPPREPGASRILMEPPALSEQEFLLASDAHPSSLADHPAWHDDHLPAHSAPVLAEPRLTLQEAARLPAKLQWSLIGWYRVTGDVESAAALLDEIETRGGETMRLLEERARLAFAAGRIDEATEILTGRVERAPSATAWVALARLHLETGDLAAAAAISRDLCRDHPELMTVGALDADVARASGDLAAARAYYEGVVADRPDNASALLALARLALLGGDAREAVGLLDRALAASDALPAGQLAAAAGIAELCDQPTRAAALRARSTRLDAERTASLARAIDEALGRSLPDAGACDEEREATPGEPVPRVSARRELERPGPATAASPTLDGDGEALASAAPPLATVAAEPDALVDPRVLEMLQRDFGHETLRPGQATVIANVLAGRDTLAIMPTGAGKSLTFQLPALLREGTTLVISPLIALMKDQVDSLPPRVRERTALLNSSLSPDEQRRVLDGLAGGVYKLIYVAPERLRQHSFLHALRTAGVSLVVVDEAHCISLWGHDFRPDYLSIPTALPELGNPSLLAITATATPRMADAIAAGFDRRLERVRISVFRPNLFYEAYRVANREEKIAKVVEVCRQERGAGIIYVSSRKDAESIAGLLRDRGVGAIPYHAGLDPETRARNQERFMRGQTRVVVATVAFGMGVDKADVRFIVHVNPPRSLEAYAQESGRAGRDGQRARCVLLTAPSDQTSMNRLARRDEIDLDTVRRVYAGVKRNAVGRWAMVDPSTLLPPLGVDADPEETADPRIALGLLAQADLVRRHPDAPISFTLRLVPDPPEGAAADPADDDPGWTRFAAWAGFAEAGRAGVTVRTAEACDALDLSPVELSRLLASRADVIVREGPRLVCLELRPVGSDAGLRLSEILATAREEARRRIAQVMAYATGGRCRHVLLANHLGEALDPCATSCDICAGTVPATQPARSLSTPAGEDAVTPRSTLTAADALAVLQAVRTLPFQMGKTGLTKLLLGSVESRIRADRSPAFGALGALKKGKIEGLIDRLIDDGYLDRDLNHEFKLISLTETGAAATIDDLAAYEQRSRPAYDPASRAGGAGGERGTRPESGGSEELGSDDEALLERLKSWRRDRAIQDGLSPAYVAHNDTLRQLAVNRPTSATLLGQIDGLGPKKIEKYGQELLEIIGAAQPT